MILKSVVLMLIILSVNLYSQVNTIKVEPKGAYKEIDVEYQNKVYEILIGKKSPERDELVEKVLSNPENYYPPTLYAVSKVLFEKNRKYDAAFWYYTGQIRARIDATLCTDRSAGSALGVLREKFGLYINQYSFSDFDNVRLILKRVYKFLENDEANYDRRWIALHGLGGFYNEDPGAKLIEPKEKWDDVKKKVISQNQEGFEKALKMMEDGSLFKNFKNGPYTNDEKDYYYNRIPMNVHDLNSVVLFKNEYDIPFGAKDKKYYFIETNKFPHADYESFEKLDYWYYKDKVQVYYQGSTLPQADPNSFMVIGRGFGKDKNSIFNGMDILDIKDPASFELLIGGYYKDKSFVYDKNFKIVDGANPNTFEIPGK